MFTFLQPYLIWIKIGAFLFVLALVAAGGYKIEKYRFDAYKAEAIAARDKQIIEAKNQEAENAKNTYIVAQAYNDRADRLAHELDRLRHQAGYNGSMPVIASGAKGANGAAAASGVASCDAEFYGKALKAEQLLEAWQEWRAKQHIPIE